MVNTKLDLTVDRAEWQGRDLAAEVAGWAALTDHGVVVQGPVRAERHDTTWTFTPTGPDHARGIDGHTLYGLALLDADDQVVARWWVTGWMGGSPELMRTLVPDRTVYPDNDRNIA